MSAQVVRKAYADLPPAPVPMAAGRAGGAMPLDPLIAALARAVERADPVQPPGASPERAG